MKMTLKARNDLAATGKLICLDDETPCQVCAGDGEVFGNGSRFSEFDDEFEDCEACQGTGVDKGRNQE